MLIIRDLCVSVSPIPSHSFLCSAAKGALVILPARISTEQHRSFAVVGPTFCNRLRSILLHEPRGLSLPLFQKHSKTFLFDPGFLSLGRESLWWDSLEEVLYKSIITVQPVLLSFLRDTWITPSRHVIHLQTEQNTEHCWYVRCLPQLQWPTSNRETRPPVKFKTDINNKTRSTKITILKSERFYSPVPINKLEN